MSTLVMRAVCVLAIPLMSVGFSMATGETVEQSSVFWRPQPDAVYLQEFGEKVATEFPVSDVVALDDTVLALANGKVHRLSGTTLVPAADAPEGVTRLRVLNGAIWSVGKSGVYRLEVGKWNRIAEGEYVDACLHLGAVHVATRDEIYRIDTDQIVNIKPEGGYLSNDSTVLMEDFTQVLADPVRIGPIERIMSYSGTLYLLRPGGLALLNMGQYVEDPIDWGTLPSRITRDALSAGNRLYITTDRGLGVLRGMALTVVTGEEGLPYEDTTCLAAGFDGDLWIGTTTGAIRQTREGFQYFGAHHWLPGDYVNAIAVGEDVVYIATNSGLGVIRYEPYTLAKKAAYYERELEEWGQKRLGFVHKLFWSRDENTWIREVSDNDGGHTSHYLAAMSFKYAATNDKHAREEAVNAFKAMAWLDSITPKPGFIARAIWAENVDKGKRAERGSGGLPAKWYPSDDGLWQWKGDTSSDEVNGHIYSVALFHDLVAEGAEKERAKKHIANIASHIMDNGWVLMDMDGKPTRWGRWDPDYLLRPYGYVSNGLNGMEAQTYMWTAYGLTGDSKYMEGLEQLIQWRYHTFTVRQKLTFPPDTVVPWDDELAFRSYHALLTHCTDPGLRSVYLRSIERSWEVMRMQHIPYFNFIYGAMTGNDCEEDRAVQYLREWPVDLVGHSYTNSHRHDLAPEPGYVPYGGGTRGISPREQEAMWGSKPTILYDGGSGSRSVTPPVGWLEDYWMGRYYGFIEAPDIKDKKLTSIEERPFKRQGAAPYDGPARPDDQIMAY
ncbi:MAG: hypothetical protein AMXMBFR84_15370 [Candidatus Hydrogenedentota bacterium]